MHSNVLPEIYRPSRRTVYELPLYACPVSAGFPSPAEDYLEGKLDLNQYLIQHPAATFFVRVTGDSMIGAGIHAGDILIVDRSLEPRDNKVVIAVVNGELLVKRLRMEKQKIYLASENSDYPPLVITDLMDFEVWGVVTNVIHPL
ncbi:translesion error-prone DNA polymerase V autoproteolytic subunit [Synechocystis sp. FACHB-383]|uniref:LexA family protein n=1 Tax=Synechocystis sp. FACHB-383 TaxID=2692864 RepID=UPI001687AFAC|nr:translesion error-prone DNA polymerase V autoproteolytic subunit [Synechocystis sp. FACHB-383]MBD2655494.1 translesion error-prone DNA polymerase V autoproteolytic subunit [Synechocystis sp. FACHB-383]